MRQREYIRVLTSGPNVIKTRKEQAFVSDEDEASLIDISQVLSTIIQ